MQRLLGPLALSLALSAPAAGGPAHVEGAAPHPLVAQVRGHFDEVQRLRELAFDAEVAIDVHTPESLVAEVREMFEEEFDEEAEDVAHAVYSAFGLVDPDTDLRATMLGMMGEMVGGYYDPEEKTLFLVERADDWPIVAALADAGLDLDDVVAVHELVHALQDQRWDLASLTTRDFESEDVLSAVRALVEGDASYLETRWTYLAMGLDPDADEGSDEVLLTMPEADYVPGPGDPPLVLMRVLTFPYANGPGFIRDVWKQRGGWSGVDALYGPEQMPLSTEQILHPEKLLGERDNPQIVRFHRPKRALGNGWELVDVNASGELGLEIVFTQALRGHPDLRAWCEGWDGDGYAVYRNAEDQLAVLWRSTWDTETDATEFTEGVRAWFDRRGTDGVIERRGSDVAVVFGVPDELRDRAVAAVWRAEATEFSSYLDVSRRGKKARKKKKT